MKRISLLVVPFALSFAACGSPLGKDGAEEGTMGASIDLNQEAQYNEQATVCPRRHQDVWHRRFVLPGHDQLVAGQSRRQDFAIVRVSDGTGFMDPKFVTNWKAAKAAGLAVGAYQFFRPTQDATAQADLMVNQLNAVCLVPATFRRSLMGSH